MKNNRTYTPYYLGLDIGTDSVGFAAAKTDYTLLKFRGEPIWGVQTFEEAGHNEERRSFRTARRRLDRKQQRIRLTQELFAEEIAKIDPLFYRRLEESALFAEDRSYGPDVRLLVSGDLDDRTYHKRYPTIHHLICALMDGTAPQDARLVYLAVAYIMGHRGHFLKEVDKENIDAVTDFKAVYQEFCNWFADMQIDLPWDCSDQVVTEMEGILKSSLGIKGKKEQLSLLLFGGKKAPKDEAYPLDRDLLLSLLCGGKADLKKLFRNEGYSEQGSVELKAKDEDIENILTSLDDDDAELFRAMKNLYDWSVLVDLLRGKTRLSDAKVAQYEQHQQDLKQLKYFVRLLCPEKYDEVFRLGKSNLKNYVGYSQNVKSLNPEQRKAVDKNVLQSEFCDYLNKLLKGCKPGAKDQAAFDVMLQRIQDHTFMPKQVDGENRVIPYQLYWAELKQVLLQAQNYLPFLKEMDADGLTGMDKLLSVMEFRVPYFVGPLNSHSKFAWIQRKAEGKIYPWNFDQMVDLDASENAFIQRMVGGCTYLAGEKALPKCSIRYQRYEVLSELNNLRVDGVPLPVEIKQGLVKNLYEQHARVTVKQVKNYLKSNGIPGELTGYADTLKASMRSWGIFRNLLQSKVLTEAQAEDIIAHLTCTEDRRRAQRWLTHAYPALTAEDSKYILRQNFKDFGRLSEKFLTGVYEANPDTGEAISILSALWNGQENLMQLLSATHSYRQQIEEQNKAYYALHPQNLTQRMEEMYLPNGVKRPILRTLDIVDDIVKARGVPQKIFIEMARGPEEGKKGKVPSSRKSQLQSLYKNFPKAEIQALSDLLDATEERALQSKVLYLYFLQLGKDMYTGRPIRLEDLKTGVYNIDHIYPQSKVKDDSLDNRVLVNSVDNGQKKDEYPIRSEIRSKMYHFWRDLLDKGLISRTKWDRLTRSTPFTEEEKMGFINRQLVETRQSTKAVATLLKERYPDADIIYVKAALASAFRREFDLPKSRTVNDTHHAKDAYLNIVVGNVYDGCFTRNPGFHAEGNYSIKPQTLFTAPRKCGNTLIWRGEEDLALVKRIAVKNNIRYTRYAFCRSGGLFKANPLRVGAKDDSVMIPRKSGMPVGKYGGYDRPTVSYFAMVKYRTGKKNDVMVMPVELMHAYRYENDLTFRSEYAKATIGKIIKGQVDEVSFPLGNRKLKINSVLVFDSFAAAISGKGSGASILLCPVVTLAADSKTVAYIKRLEIFSEKQKNANNLTVSPGWDHITQEENLMLYDYYMDKLNHSPFSVMYSSAGDTLQNKRTVFTSLSIEQQVSALMSIGTIFKTGRKGECDLKLIGGAGRAAGCTASSKISVWKKNYKKVYLVDQSASGLFQNRSCNLLELL